MTNQHRIVRRAFSTYTDAEVFTGTWVEAVNRSMDLQHANHDGEYLVRGIDEPNVRPSSGSYQSGLDWL